MGFCLMSMASCSFLPLLMSGKEIRLCYGALWLGVFGLGRVRSQVIPCRFCGAPGGDGHLLFECTFPPLVEIRENPEFHDLMRMDKGHWPRCLLWHGVNGAFPWGSDASESAFYLVETALGHYSSRLVAMVLMLMRFLRVCLMLLRFGLMVVWFWIRSLVSLLQVLGCLLISLNTAGEAVGGAMSIMFSLLVLLILVGLLSLFLVLRKLFRGLSCGGSFMLFNLLMLFILELINVVPMSRMRDRIVDMH